MRYTELLCHTCKHKRKIGTLRLSAVICLKHQDADNVLANGNRCRRYAKRIDINRQPICNHCYNHITCTIGDDCRLPDEVIEQAIEIDTSGYIQHCKHYHEQNKNF